MNQPTRKRILVITATGQKARRDKLAGIYDYAHGQGWVIRTVEEPAAAPLLKASLRTGGIDGIISDGFNAPVKLTRTAARDFPIVYIDRPHGNRSPDVCVNNDDAACARLAVRTFADLGLRHLAAVGTAPSVYWSKTRIRFCAAYAHELGLDCVSFRPSDDMANDITRLREWLRDLPRPCGLFAVTDAVAKHCIDLLTESGVRIPEEVAVIGIDNDELVCENTTPSISSILPGFRQAGRLAAERLHRLMDGSGCEDLSATYGPQAVIRRGSTCRPAVRQDKIPEVLEFIRRHACLGIRVTDVVAFAGLPKSTPELHFRLATMRSIQQEIQRVRLEEVKRLLRDTRCPIGTIAARCGYHNDNHLKNLFKRTCGKTLSQYRAASKGG